MAGHVVIDSGGWGRGEMHAPRPMCSEGISDGRQALRTRLGLGCTHVLRPWSAVRRPGQAERFLRKGCVLRQRVRQSRQVPGAQSRFCSEATDMGSQTERARWDV